MACALPAEQDVPLSRWSSPESARGLAARCQVTVSASSVRRWLAADALGPWQHRSWISIRDPHFETRAARVVDLYAGIWDGQPLGPNDFAICSDEKTPSRPAAAATPPCRRDGPGRCGSSTNTTAGGAVAYLAARDVHRGQASIDRMNRAWPTAHLIHTPVHASWLNQCEIYFSVVQRKVVARRVGIREARSGALGGAAAPPGGGPPAGDALTVRGRSGRRSPSWRRSWPIVSVTHRE